MQIGFFEEALGKLENSADLRCLEHRNLVRRSRRRADLIGAIRMILCMEPMSAPERPPLGRGRRVADAGSVVALTRPGRIVLSGVGPTRVFGAIHLNTTTDEIGPAPLSAKSRPLSDVVVKRLLPKTAPSSPRLRARECGNGTCKGWRRRRDCRIRR